ncbi:AMP-binding protein [Aeromicrobium sp. 636]|uniref:acetate--CoA ligase n=1 Tax=Aeromicrobium senzhongii TaxID=2663859 RepID=A0A8I0EW82_9ACTN|nr:MULTISPECIES: AMP-binding protein [Aeromicrobium]MBC9226483.1 AMP-binding protein [Aeromicrobium senzhongii]MCQ3998587.1 AMP-binding protein [Aeromicrobium sp. 636]
MRGPGLFADPATPVWVPSAQQRERSRLLTAMQRWGHDSVESLHAASIDDPEWFWRAVVEDLRIDFSAPFSRVKDESAGVPFPRWFVGGRLNAADLCSHRHATGPLADKAAVVFEGDGGQCRSLTYRELDVEVRRFAANLASRGVHRGDRVVLFLPVLPEAVVAYLGAAAIGAIVVPAFTGYGPEALATRLRDSEAKVLVTVDGTTRRGKPVAMKSVADEALASAPSVELSIVVAHSGEDVPMQSGRDVYWHDLDQEPSPVETVAMDSNDPLTIIYTSGTTGAPKGIVHSHAGFSVKAAVDFAYGFDIHEDDVIAWIADMGWMLGPLLIMGGLQFGATIVLVEGLPHHPDPQRLWEIAERNEVTFQGIAPTAARLLMNEGALPKHEISSIRSFASTGEGWDAPTWHWLFTEVGDGTRPIVNYSGGTETGGGILVGYPFLPMAAAGFNGPLPGMDVAVLDQDGRPVVGQVGELSVLNTWPGMTHAFWQDRERYLKTYWDRWPEVWVHGDLAEVHPDGSWQLHGRSDDTIKVSGRRVGPAEIEAALLSDSRILEAAVVGVPDEMRGQRVVAFAVVREGADLEDVRATALHHVGRSFAPTLHVVRSLPKTKNGKIMRRAIRARHLGDPPGDMSALEPTTPLEHIPTIQEAGDR